MRQRRTAADWAEPEEDQHVSDAFNFAQDLLGKSSARSSIVQTTGNPANSPELLEWVATITGRRPIQQSNAAGRFAEEAPSAVDVADFVSSLREGTWDSAKHPRRGGPPNAGWFASTGTPGYTSPGTSPPPSSVPTTSSQPAKDDPASPAERDRKKQQDVRTYLNILYGDKGPKLLRAFEKAGGLIQFEDRWFGKSSLASRSIWDPPRISLGQDLNPSEAAQELMARLIDASGLTEVRWHLDHSGFKNVDLLRDSYRQSFKQSAGAVALAAELFLSGVSIANEGADWVVTFHELSEGNLHAAIGFLPLVPAAVGKTGIVLKHGRESIRISSETARKVKALPIDELLDLLGSTRKLAINMEKAGITRPAGTAAHHIVPAGLKKYADAVKARELLERLGISVHNAANGVYLPAKFDDAVKAIYHSKVHTKKYFEQVWLRLKKAKSKEQALIILNQIRSELLSGKFKY